MKKETQFIIDWTGRMSKKYGGTISIDGTPYDWGQAICYGRYGKDWNKILLEQNIEDPDEKVVEIAKEWENNDIPNYITILQ